MMLAKRAPIRAAPAQRAVRRVVVCQAVKPEESVNPLKVAAASMVTAALLVAGSMSAPEEALAAQRSGGRVGGSSGFAARKAPPARSVQTQAAPTINNTTVVVGAPPVFSPFGFSPFGGFGFGFGMPIYMGGGGIFSGLLGLMAITLLFSVVFNVIRGFSAQKSKKDDSWGDL
ncbi:hypothetical protein HYH03_002224 [Edaphochlamys debaryana]|uniref:Uncharacterized protein n=1 Tax=Edaphochlamys debaryana TaxID=47281 RepID=A0A835YBL8_9CHLO|nr:hypothetical protein HYH03_002224 [Edaphochlamys debaryana]|eukprot:KAG2499937.1 hypothetical protein HYH03_002224 [Edaphochlamys debaryana]